MISKMYFGFVAAILSMGLVIAAGIGEFYQLKHSYRERVKARIASTARILEDNSFENLALLNALTDFLTEPEIAAFSVTDLVKRHLLRQSGVFTGDPDVRVILSENGRERLRFDVALSDSRLVRQLIRNDGIFLLSIFGLMGLIVLFSVMQSRMLVQNRIALGHLAAKTAHDIRSPLSALHIALSTAKFDSPDAESIARRAIERVKSIMDELLVTRRKYELGPNKTVPLKKTPKTEATAKISVQSVLAALNDLTEEKKAEFATSPFSLTYSTAGDRLIGEVSGQAVDLLRIVSNLVNNSLESTDAAVDIKIKTEVIDGNLLIRVQDNGPGIPENVLNAIQNKRSVSTKAEGNGLGLTMAYELAEKWNWSMTCWSDIGRGTIFTLSLPIVWPSSATNS